MGVNSVKFGSKTIIDISDSTVTPETLGVGVTAYDKSGEKIIGTLCAETGLNFEIVGGTAEPSNPEENTIWVNTDTNITGWEFSANEPYSGELELDTTIDIEKQYIKSTGAQTANDYFSIAIIEIPERATELTVKLSGNTASSVYHAFYDASGTLMSTIQRKVGTTTIAIPSGAKTIKMSFRTNDNPSVKCVIVAQGIEEGTVYFKTGTSSSAPLNVLKNNNITVYPISAKQCIGGSLSNKTAKIWQNGEWVEIIDTSLAVAQMIAEYETALTTMGVEV